VAVRVRPAAHRSAPARPGFPAGVVPLAAVPTGARSRRFSGPVQPALPGFGDEQEADDVGAGALGPAAAPARPVLAPADLRDLLGVPYTDEQVRAICAPVEPAVIVAGAGSGKTSVMAARVVWLVASAGVPAEQILGLTFTRKAAGELADRVRVALAKLRRSGAAPGGDGELGEPTVSTYNAFAGRLVGEHALRLGLEPDCAVLPSAARYQLAGRVAREYAGRVEALTTSMSGLVDALVALDGECGEHLVEPAELVAFDRRWLRDVLTAIERAGNRPNTATLLRDLRKLGATARGRIELAGLVTAYRAARRDRDLLDFGDQVTLAARLAEGVPEVGPILRRQYAVVLLDEYQDTSVAQRRLLVGLFGGGHPVTAVGDPAQAIYGWRGASASNLDRFPEHFRRTDGSPAQTYPLSVNQRSGGRLLELANGVAARLPARRVTVLTPREDAHDAGRTVVALHTTWGEEVAWIAARLAALVGDGYCQQEDCAVLVRSWSDVPALVGALTDAGLRVEVLGLGGLLVKPEIADIRAVLEVLDDQTANAALMRLLTGPRLRLGPRDLAALGRRAVELLRSGATRRDALDPAAPPAAADSPGPADPSPAAPAAPAPAVPDALVDAVAGIDPCDIVSVVDALGDPGPELSADAADRVRRLADELAGLRSHVGAGLVELIHRVVEAIGLDVEIELAAGNGGRGRDNLAAFLRVAADFERSASAFDDASGSTSLTSFLGYLRAGEQYDRGMDADVPGTGTAVSVLTMHGSKGLEWEVVAVPNLSRGSFPDVTVRERWTTAPRVLPTPLRGDAADLPAFEVDDSRAVLDAFLDDSRTHLEREERRLAYVALTRAKSMLIGSGHWWGPTQKKPRGPSSFLDELRAHADRPGFGRVEVWAPRPEEKANPALEVPRRHPWPVPFDPDLLARRQEAAREVRELLARRGTDDSSPGGFGADHLGAGGFAAAGSPPAGSASNTAALAGPVPGGVLPSRSVPEPDHVPDHVPDHASVHAIGDSRNRPTGSAPDVLAGVTPRERALLAELDREAAMLLDEELAARSPTRTVALPGSLTATQIMKLRSDPDELARELARPMPRRPAPAASRGIRFHAWAEEIFDRRPLIDHEDLPGAADERFDDAELDDLRQAFLGSEYGGRRPLAVEAPFELPLGGRVVRGRIDAVYELGGGRYEVVDWKTGAMAADPVQLAVYRLAWARVRRVPVEAVEAAFLYVRTGRVVRPPLMTEAELVTLLGAA
jgi:DNA helicase-2/ATP-dependent DNA helicase PcrA